MVTFPPGLTPGTATPRRGRSVVATQSFAPGAAIAVVTGTDRSNPSVALPDSPHLADTCHYCLSVANAGTTTAATTAPTVRVRACTGCRTAHYCSTACQKADWSLVHGKGECKTFKRVRSIIESEPLVNTGTPDSLPTPIRALIQVLLRPEMREAAAEMEGHLEMTRTRASGGTEQDMVFQARGALHYMGREECQDSIMEVIEILCQIQVNSFNRIDADTGQSGVYINTVLAMLNHSCLPNAFVRFVRRKAILHAYREIKPGEEIEISYIDIFLPRSRRREALKTRYNFDCVCPRCKDDLDIYQVCQRYPHLELNSFSLAPDLDKLRNPPIKQFLHSDKSLQKNVDEIYSTCSTVLDGLSLADKRRQLRQRWNMCAQLRKAELYAIDPLALVLIEAIIYFMEVDKSTYGLAISCFLSLHSDPYRWPMPFDGQRVKSMIRAAKFLANTASAAPSAPDTGLAAKVSQALSKMDQVTMCQTVLSMAIRYCPAAHSTEWLVYHEARGMLNDIESLSGRGTENALVNAFNRNPNGPEERRFFESIVLEPLQVLAGFALEIMDAEFSA
ncbi:SET domain-containing protein [Hypoxylon sp. FL1857]|nr:SET domain-containing protein [Hypoxylon sp. FL1857]